MSKNYKYAGLTKELHQRLVNERVALKLAHPRDYKQYFQKVRQCSEKQAIIILQALNSAVVERQRISPQTVDRLEGIISDELYHDLKEYLANHYTRGKTIRPVLEKTNAGLPAELFQEFREEVEVLRKEHPKDLNIYIRERKGCDKGKASKAQDAINQCYSENATLTPLKAVYMEGVLSRGLFSKIASYVFNNYDWPDKLDDDADRIMLEYRNKGELGRNKTTVRKALYKAYALGV